MTTAGLHPRRLPDRLRPQLDEGGQAHLGDDPRGGHRRPRSHRRRAERDRGRPRRQLRRRALRHAGTPRRLPRRRRSGVLRPADRAPRGGLRLGIDRASGRVGRDRGRALRLRARRRRRADEDASPAKGGDFLGTAAWYEREAKGVEFPFPEALRSARRRVRPALRARRTSTSARITAINYYNARRNPQAQTRTWYMTDEHACRSDKYNAVIGGRIKVTDCSQVTDGAVAVFLASEAFAKKWAARRGTTARPACRGCAAGGIARRRLTFDDKVAESRDQQYVLPHTRQAIIDAYRRAGIADCWGARRHRDARLLHDLRVHGDRPLRPHQAGRVVEGGRGGRHRARRQAADQPVGRAHRLRPPGRRHRRAPAPRRLPADDRAAPAPIRSRARATFATLNIGGSGTTSCVFIVGT